MSWFDSDQKAPATRAEQDIYIVSVGAYTSLGDCAASSSVAVRANRKAFAEHPYVIDLTGEPLYVARSPLLPEDLGGVDRFLSMAQPALTETLGPVAKLGLKAIPLILGLPAERPGLPAALGDHLKQRLKATEAGRVLLGDIQVLSEGHASGIMALKTACEMIRNNQSQFCVVGGVDSYLEPETLEWLEENDQVHRAGPLKNAWGFTPGEGAGFCLLTSDWMMKDKGLKPLARVASTATAQEKNLIKTDTVCVGAGLSEAYQRALMKLPADLKIDQLICDHNGEIYRADEFGFSLARISDRLGEDRGILTPAKCWGDCGAASGPLFAILAIEAGQKGYAKGPHTLLSASSEGGERAAVILHVENQIRER